jgi:hypothetical protein
VRGAEAVISDEVPTPSNQVRWSDRIGPAPVQFAESKASLPHRLLVLGNTIIESKALCQQ